MRSETILILTLLLYCISGGGGEQVEDPGGVQGHPRQERRNRMVPDFKPFQHPAHKVSSSGLTGQGPISRVEWLELVPVFGHIYAADPHSNKPSNILLILGLGSGSVVLLAFFIRSKSSAADSARIRDGVKSKQEREVNHSKAVTIQPPTETEGSKEPIFNRVERVKTKENGSQIVVPKTTADSIQNESPVSPKICSQEITPTLDSKFEKGNGSIRKKAEVEVIKLASEKFSSKEETQRKVCNAKQITSEDEQFDTKVRSFKITKVPKTQNCTSSDHGVITEVLSVLEVVQLQRVETLRISTPTASANVEIEGANMSRLRITDIQEKNETEYLAKTMTVKEYMMCTANMRIEEAVRLVRVDCSIQNIRNLAETIKKYRPDQTGPTTNGI